MSFGRDKYIYAVSRIRHKETKLLSKKDIEQMISMQDIESVLRFLAEHGYGDETSYDSVDTMLRIEGEKVWQFIKELTDDLNVFDFLRIQNDYHNLKAAVKAVYTETTPDGLFKNGSKYDPASIYEALNKKEYNLLPDEFSTLAQSALTELLRTGDGQLVDIMIDRACLERINTLGRESNEEIVRYYCDTFVASGNIKIAVRSALMSKPSAFIREALSECDILDIDKLALCAAKGFDEVCDYLAKTDYKDAVPAVQESLSAFEKWCDNRLMDVMKTQKSEPFSIGPLVAYVFAKEQEIKAVRLILSAKENVLSDLVVRERVRDMYV